MKLQSNKLKKDSTRLKTTTYQSSQKIQNTQKPITPKIIAQSEKEIPQSVLQKPLTLFEKIQARQALVNSKAITQSEESISSIISPKSNEIILAIENKTIKQKPIISERLSDNNSETKSTQKIGINTISQKPVTSQIRKENENQKNNIDRVLTSSSSPAKKELLSQVGVQQFPVQKNTQKSVANSIQPLGNINLKSPSSSGQKMSLKQNKNPYELGEDELSQYGDRFPEKYEKVKLLGKGGFALVWQGQHKLTQKSYALKQINKNLLNYSWQREIEFCELFFTQEGEPHEDIKNHPGLVYLTRLYEKIETSKDTWLVYEQGGENISKQLSSIKGEFYKGERIYNVTLYPLYQCITRNSYLIASLIDGIAQVLKLFQQRNIIHSDLKPENILVNIDQNNYTIKSLKIIDYGSSLSFENLCNIGMATPEYTPPEILEVLLNNKNKDHFTKKIQRLKEISQPYSIDMWSLGCVILEIITGVPIWMSLKCKITIDNKIIMATGLFAAKGRGNESIIQKQKTVLKNIQNILLTYIQPDNFHNFELFIDLLVQIMNPQPGERLSPEQVLNHPFIKLTKPTTSSLNEQINRQQYTYKL